MDEKKDLLQEENGVKAQTAEKPGPYSSKWSQQLNDSINKILGRKDFSYDVNGDALYQQYKDRYIQGGQMAMMDTLGQAATLTGGYGNSYAQMAGQQAYQGYLQGLNDKIPELYQLALDKYDREGDALYKQYSLLGAQEGQDYDRYQQALGQDQQQRQQDWENAFRLYQLGIKTPEVLGILGIPEEPVAADVGGDEGKTAVRRGAKGDDGSSNEDFYETYLNLKKSGVSQKDLDGLLAEARADGTLRYGEDQYVRDSLYRDTVTKKNGSAGTASSVKKYGTNEYKNHYDMLKK